MISPLPRLRALPQCQYALHALFSAPSTVSTHCMPRLRALHSVNTHCMPRLRALHSVSAPSTVSIRTASTVFAPSTVSKRTACPVFKPSSTAYTFAPSTVSIPHCMHRLHALPHALPSSRPLQLIRTTAGTVFALSTVSIHCTHCMPRLQALHSVDAYQCALKHWTTCWTRPSSCRLPVRLKHCINLLGSRPSRHLPVRFEALDRLVRTHVRAPATSVL